MNEQQATPARAPQTSGFTLMEMMIVMVLIVILAGIGLTMYGNSVQRAKEAVLKEDLFRMRDAIDQYYADKNKYPANLDALVSEKYLRAVPVDPFTGSAPTAGRPRRRIRIRAIRRLESGISNVKSGSDQTGLDGSRYADW